MTQTRCGEVIRTWREAKGWSLGDLGTRIYYSRGHIGHVENGEKHPSRQFAKRADEALDAHGEVMQAWSADDATRREAARLGKLVGHSVADSLLLLETEDPSDLDALQERAEQLSVAYLSSAPAPMLAIAVDLRSQLFGRIRSRHYRVGRLHDLYRTASIVQGVLSYAALDLGHAEAAMTHAAVAWSMAERADDNELRVWVRGTESLIARFGSDYDHALALVDDGLRYPTKGTGHLRLLAGVAQCRSNLGDSGGANAALDEAARERDHLTTKDSTAGLFEFSAAKQHYYAGSSLIWLPHRADARRAARESAQAIAMWECEPPATRSLDDEALAHVYAATAHVHLGALDAAAEAIRPVLELPADRQISWINKRLRGLATELELPPYLASPEASALRERILHAAG